MRIKILTIFCLCLLYAGRASAQWAVIDPSNIAQSILDHRNEYGQELCARIG